MAIDFPSTPSDNQTFVSDNVTYTYSETKGLWYTKANVDVVPIITTLVEEGTNLYYTNARVYANVTPLIDALPSQEKTFTAKQSFVGSSSSIAAEFRNLIEDGTVSATAAANTINFDVLTQSVLYYTSDAEFNFDINVRGNSSTALDSLLDVGDAITVAFLATNGSTGYYLGNVQVDGNTISALWQGNTAPSEGNTDSVDAYSITVIKTAATPTYTVLASQTQFA